MTVTDIRSPLLPLTAMSPNASVPSNPGPLQLFYREFYLRKKRRVNRCSTIDLTEDAVSVSENEDMVFISGEDTNDESVIAVWSPQRDEKQSGDEENCCGHVYEQSKTNKSMRLACIVKQRYENMKCPVAGCPHTVNIIADLE
jgi:hypothetical protein